METETVPRTADPRTVLLTVAEAADRLRVNHMTLRRRIDRGRIKVIDISDDGATRPKLRITEAALAAYIASCQLS